MICNRCACELQYHSHCWLTIKLFFVTSLSNAHTSCPLQGDKSVRVMRSLLAAQQTFVDRLVQLMKAVQRESGNRKKKVRLEYLHMQTRPLNINSVFL